jgi:acyl-CoA synthetase (AMP-forming)/AMP-acid ligase II
VRDVAVVGLPSERWGEEVTAVVVADEGHDLTDSDIMRWARSRIAGYKAPKSVRFAESLPRNASGKILRRELRERFGG